MKIFRKISDIVPFRDQLSKGKKTIGFVPTMGALHKGHLSLLKNSQNQNDVSIVSIFVNPTQFNDNNDYSRYPRDIENDIQILLKNKCDILFNPSEIEMYPEPDTRVFDFGYLDKILEGQFRKGHFNGVALIVSKLFDIIKPNNAYFGEKDYQQYLIIKELSKKMYPDIKIISCPIIREPDGLAMSSRNKLLDKAQRRSAVEISKILFNAQQQIKNKNVKELKNWVINHLNSVQNLSVEYFEIVDDSNLKPIKVWSEQNNKIGCIAVKIGNIRLIDNVRFYL